MGIVENTGSGCKVDSPRANVDDFFLLGVVSLESDSPSEGLMMADVGVFGESAVEEDDDEDEDEEGTSSQAEDSMSAMNMVLLCKREGRRV